MADDNVVSRYVKLTKEGESPLEEIRPGELNQPVQVPQLVVHTCRECGQPLPESYEPPADEPWTTGICGCAEDRESLWLGLFCPCVLFGRNVERMREETPWTGPCTCHAIFVEGGMALALATAIFHGVDPHGAFLIGEGLLFAWWMCGIYTGLFVYYLHGGCAAFTQVCLGKDYKGNTTFRVHLVIHVLCIVVCIGVHSVKNIEKCKHGCRTML